LDIRIVKFWIKYKKNSSENGIWKLELCLDMNIILGGFWSFVSDLSEKFENQLFVVFQIFEKFQNASLSENWKIYDQMLISKKKGKFFEKKWKFLMSKRDESLTEGIKMQLNDMQINDTRFKIT